MFTEDQKPDVDFHYLVIPSSSFSGDQENYSEADPDFPIFVHVVHLLAYLPWPAPAETGGIIFSSGSNSLLPPGIFIFWKRSDAKDSKLHRSAGYYH